MKHSKVLIIGSGPAGYTAAIYTARAMLKPMMVQGTQPGGQLTITTDVENYPGFGDVIQGPWLMEQMQQQAKSVGTDIITDMIKSVDFGQRPFTAVGESGETYTADSVIISTGAQARWLGIDSEKKFNGYGVSACATCDGFFFKDKTVLVVGGGNSAVEEALYLTNIASKVYLVHRRDSLRAEKILQDRLFSNPKVQVIWNSQIEEVIGNDDPLNVTGVKLKNTKDDFDKEFRYLINQNSSLIKILPLLLVRDGSSTKKFQVLSDYSRNTLKKDLQYLVKEGLILTTGSGRGVHYHAKENE